MKLAIAAFAFACMSYGANAEPAVRGTKDAEPAVRKLEGEGGTGGTTGGTTGGPTVGELQAVPIDTKMAPDYDPLYDAELKRAPDGEGIDQDHYYYPYQTGSCTCAKEAYLAVYKAAQSQLKMVPLVLVDAIFPKIQREINRLLDFAVCFLHSIDCGCDDSKYGYKVINRYKVSTFQCCCDVHAIKDIIIKGIQDLAKWEMTMDAEHNTVVDTGLVHKRAEYHVLENIVQKVYKNVRAIGGLYIEKYEDCLDAICADDSLFKPSLPIQATWDEEYDCGNEGDDQCQLVCDVNGKTVCGWTAGDTTFGTCSEASDCTEDLPSPGGDTDAWKCIPAEDGDSYCVAIVEGDTPCP